MTKQDAIAEAYRTANRTGKICLVVNLNPFGSLWVVREWSERLAKDPSVIACSPIGWPNEHEAA